MVEAILIGGIGGGLMAVVLAIVCSQITHWREQQKHKLHVARQKARLEVAESAFGKGHAIYDTAQDRFVGVSPTKTDK
jgi:hypothetical protein